MYLKIMPGVPSYKVMVTYPGYPVLVALSTKYLLLPDCGDEDVLPPGVISPQYHPLTSVPFTQAHTAREN